MLGSGRLKATQPAQQVGNPDRLDEFVLRATMSRFLILSDLSSSSLDNMHGVNGVFSHDGRLVKACLELLIPLPQCCARAQTRPAILCQFPSCCPLARAVTVLLDSACIKLHQTFEHTEACLWYGSGFGGFEIGKEPQFDVGMARNKTPAAFRSPFSPLYSHVQTHDQKRDMPLYAK
ncbi:uncharacterized protein PV09_03741 [Verruconis gallopava]|uniref:Uncharacterized protein n=1 Tax=Verruconis gallopava TaxID=253628 RepID=A0A0D1YWV0_9PEZI|nr:uncharacterized protein PV09_03741 [Verruconis gallopava]KIW05197.1 hypothetical protein PV09_03741 [Verruconis gallopava]